MIKNLINLVLIFFTGLFFFIVTNQYLSDQNKKLIQKNRSNFDITINEKITNLPLLKNDTNNVIEFNDGYKNSINKENRKFWQLMKKDE
jgi:hypothetical protein